MLADTAFDCESVCERWKEVLSLAYYKGDALHLLSPGATEHYSGSEPYKSGSQLANYRPPKH